VKVAIIGTGHIGATLAYTLLLRGSVAEIVLVNRSKEKAFGEVLDMTHAVASAARPTKIYFGDAAACRGAAVTIVTAGAAIRPGQSRIDVARDNALLFKALIPEIVAANADGIILVVTNPVDIATYFALRCSRLPSARVFGSGTELDSQRFRSFLSLHFDVNPGDVHAHVIGEHGDSMVPVWSGVSIGGVPLERLSGYDADAMADLFEITKSAATMVRATKDSTQFATALSVAKIVEAILTDRKQVLTVSTVMRNTGGDDSVCLSFPAVVGRNGIERVLPVPLADDERAQLAESARMLSQVIGSVDIDIEPVTSR